MDPLFAEKSLSLAEECGNADDVITLCLYPMIKIPRNFSLRSGYALFYVTHSVGQVFW